MECIKVNVVDNLGTEPKSQSSKPDGRNLHLMFLHDNMELYQ
jgi:hypothetical protein